MIYLSYILFVLGMCVELAGLLGAGWSYTAAGIILVLAGGILWGLCAPKGRPGSR